MLTKEFVTAGKAIFTVAIPKGFASQHDTSPHYTFKVTHKEANGNWGETWFVSLLVGPNNTEDYAYVGTLDARDGSVRMTAKSCYNKDCWPVRLLQRVLSRLWAGEGDAVKAAGFDVYHEGRCGRCGRCLTVPASIESGIGPECAKKVA